MIQLREFVNIHEQTYKIGRSKDVHQRYQGYPKDSIHIYSRVVNDEVKLEQLIKEQFKIDFIQKRIYGIEYFKGDHNKMIDVMNEIIVKHDNVVIQPENNIIESYNQLNILSNKLIDLIIEKDQILSRQPSQSYSKLITIDDVIADVSAKIQLLTSIEKPKIIPTLANHEYIRTKDSIFHIYMNIPSDFYRATLQLTDLFIVNMCGAYGKYIFPNEPTHGQDTTYPVVAALYNIFLEDDTYYLSGVIRYKYQSKNMINIKKLSNMQKRSEGIRVYIKTPALWQNKQYHLSKPDIKRMISKSGSKPIGSNVQDFYRED